MATATALLAPGSFPTRLLGSLALLLALLLAPAALAANITVNTFDDEDNGDGDCSLREAVRAANTNVAVDGCAAGETGADTITFSALLLDGTITLELGELTLTDDVTVDGGTSPVTRITVDAEGTSRIFDVAADTEVAFASLVLANGHSGEGGSSAPDAGGAVDLKAGSAATFTDVDVRDSVAGINGGGIHGAGNTAIVITTTPAGSSTISGNEARGNDAGMGGGGVWGAGSTVITGDVLLDGNSATGTSGSGGGVFNFGGTLDITGATISNNTANRAGAGVEDFGDNDDDVDVMLTDVTLSGNAIATASPGNGGGFHSGGGEVVVTGGTVTGNTAVEGGGLWASGSLSIDGTEVTDNIATGNDPDQGGGGIYSEAGSIAVADATITGNTATGTAGSGGGILANGGTFSVTGGVVSDNASNRAGGGIEVVSAELTLDDVDFAGNDAGMAPGNGGALHIGGTGTATVSGGTVTGNTAVEGGGFWNGGQSGLFVTGTAFDMNMATGAAADQGGGGLYNEGGEVTIADATFTGNAATGASGSGGGLFNNQNGTMAVTGSVITGNTANRAGGGVEDNAGNQLTLIRVTLSGNTVGTAPGNGGGLHIGGTGAAVVDSSIVMDNVAGGEGGGLWNSAAGTLVVRATTVAGNSAPVTGGIHNDGAGGAITVEQSTVSANTSAVGGGGLFSEGGTLDITNSTISGNAGDVGGGVWTTGGTTTLNSVTVASNTAVSAGGGAANGEGGTLSFLNTILADNAAPTGPDCAGTLSSDDYNLVEDVAGCAIEGAAGNTITGQDAQLGPLADNGGSTATHALLDGSPAIDAGSATLATDQRGFLREAGIADIGAFELNATPVANEGGPGGENGDPIDAAMPSGFVLEQAYPNPFRDAATLRFGVAEPQHVEVTLYNVMGQRVRVLYSGTAGGGQVQDVRIDAAGLASGLYFVRFAGESVQATQRISVTR